jgi:hypothetical protein
MITQGQLITHSQTSITNQASLETMVGQVLEKMIMPWGSLK